MELVEWKQDTRIKESKNNRNSIRPPRLALLRKRVKGSNQKVRKINPATKLKSIWEIIPWVLIKNNEREKSTDGTNEIFIKKLHEEEPYQYPLILQHRLLLEIIINQLYKL